MRNRYITHWAVYKRKDYYVVSAYDKENNPIQGYKVGPYIKSYVMAAYHAAEHLTIQGFLPVYHLKQKANISDWQKVRCWAIELWAWDPNEINLSVYDVNLTEWLNTAKVGDHYDGEGFTIDVEEYSIPGWEVRKKEDVEK